MVDEYLGSIKKNRMKKTGIQQSNNTFQQYSDASLKYIHSFLPHMAMDYHKNKGVTVSSTGANTLTPQRSRVSPIHVTDKKHTTSLTP